MQLESSPTDAHEAPVNGLVRTRYTLVVCVACQHELIHTAHEETGCPQCGGSARRSFGLFRDLREDQ